MAQAMVKRELAMVFSSERHSPTWLHPAT